MSVFAGKGDLEAQEICAFYKPNFKFAGTNENHCDRDSGARRYSVMKELLADYLENGETVEHSRIRAAIPFWLGWWVAALELE